MTNQPKVAIHWFRRDLRLTDNTSLYHSLRSGYPVAPVFIFDRNILDKLPASDLRVQFIHQTLEDMNKVLNNLGSGLKVYYGSPEQVWAQIFSEFHVVEIFTNEDYEPYALDRDRKVRDLAAQSKVKFHAFKDHVIFRGDEVSKQDGKPYTVFSPYARKWRERLQSRISDGQSYYFKPYPCEKYYDALLPMPGNAIISLQKMGFERKEFSFPAVEVPVSIIKKYDETRNYPAIAGTSRLGIHFRFGTISIREKARKALILNDTFLNELIWRDFYSQILFHFPHVAVEPFRAEYKRIFWRDDLESFEAWCQGKTGYPIVDAGMRELNATGYMHNRVRMITASFLTKHLLIDYRLGEAYFAEKLLDFDLASNNGGWQWAAGCGTDAAPYFRIFNPISQAQKFDERSEYIRCWVPEYGTTRYPKPIVDHAFARNRCLETYKTALGKSE